jgi:gas vesicle protein
LKEFFDLLFVRKVILLIIYLKQKVMKNSFGILAAFLGGAIVGGALGILFAPESGDETRKKIVEALEKRGIKLSKKEMDDLVDEIKAQTSNEEE